MILKSANFGNNAGKIRDISFFIPAQCKYISLKAYNIQGKFTFTYTCIHLLL